MTTPQQSRRERWQLGVDFSDFAIGAHQDGFKARASALKPLRERLERSTVAINCAELTRLTVAERLAVLKKAGDAINASDGVPVFELGWAAGELRSLPQGELNQTPPVPPVLLDSAQRFLSLFRQVPDEIADELEEIAGWCRATLSGWSVECYLPEFRELVAKAFESPAPYTPPPPPEKPVTFGTASLEHIRSMIALRRLCFALRKGEGEPFGARGDMTRGYLGETDQSECNYVVGWDEVGVIAFGFHKYAYSERKEPATEWLEGLPPELSRLAQQLTKGGQPYTAGFWITASGRHFGEVGLDEDGSDLIKRYGGPPEAAMTTGHMAWGPFLSKEARALAIVLARRAAAGGGAVTREEAEVLFETDEVDRRPRVAKYFAELGLAL